MAAILTVDDSTSLRKTLAFTLARAGYQVTEAVDGKDGLAKAKSQRFGVVITDQNMPIMDGLTLIRELRSLPEYQRVPILMLTTESSDGLSTRLRSTNASPQS